MQKTKPNNNRRRNSKNVSVTILKDKTENASKTVRDESATVKKNHLHGFDDVAANLDHCEQTDSFSYPDANSQSSELSYLLTCMNKHQHFLTDAWNKSTEQAADKILSSSRKMNNEEIRSLQINTFEHVFTDLFCSSEFCSNLCELLRCQTILFRQSNLVYFQIKEWFGKLSRLNGEVTRY